MKPLRWVTLACLAGLAASGRAEVHSLTLKQAVNTALQQNTEIVLARLDEQKARAAVRVAKDPFVPKVYGGSGLAYTSGYPNAIEGQAPSLFEARTDMAIFNRPKAYELASSRESARGASLDSANKADDVAYRTASLFLDTIQFEHGVESLQQEIEALNRVNEAVRLRFREGREIELTVKRADLDLARVRQRLETTTADRVYAEQSLALILGYPAGDLVQPVEGEHIDSAIPATEEASIEAALANNKDIRRLESQMQAKAFEVRAQRAQRLPQVDLVAQYSLFAQYNYQDYFRKFQRNNGQLGVSVRLPLLIGSAPSGMQAEAEADLAKLRAQVNETRNRTSLDARKSFQDVKRAESARDFAKLDLEVAREQVRVILDQLDEGRSTRQAVDQARLLEQEKWLAYYDAQHLLEKANFTLLRYTGNLIAALR